MSDHDDTLLDEDLGDEEYDLGNDEEEALLADDYEFETLPEQRTIYKGEEETDDVLDLGVTDALDDLEGEEENVQSKCKNDQCQLDEHCVNKQIVNISHEKSTHNQNKQTISQETQDLHSEEESYAPIIRPKIDLRDKLNSQREVFVGNGQGMEDDDCEEAKERRNRFQSERIIVSQKTNHNIPDSLENIVTIEQHRLHFRGRERGDRSDRGERGDRSDRIDRRSIRGRSGGRYEIHPSGRYHQGRVSSSNQQASFRTPLLENRPSFQPVPSNNIPVQQHHQMYQHQTSQLQPPYHHNLANGPMPGHPHFIDSRLPLMPSQFPEPLRPQVPRINVPRIDYGPRSSSAGQQGLLRSSGLPPGPPVLPAHPPGPSGIPSVPSIVSGPGSGSLYNCLSTQSAFGPNQAIFPNHVIHMSERGPHPGSQGPLLSMISTSSGSHISTNPGSMIPVSQGVPVQSFTRSQVTNPSATHQNHPNLPSQSSYENRLQFPPDSQFEGHSSFDSRNTYSSSSVNQFNNNMSQITRPVTQNTSQQLLMGITNVSGISSISNVTAIPTGHKILINPHFRGNLQVKNEGKTVQDHADKFVQALRNASNSNIRDNRSNNQQAKSDDPYSYFSDVWQETKSQRLQNITSHRSYSPDNNYSKNSIYNSYDNKYKSESMWSHKDVHSEDHKISRDTYREKELSPRSRSEQKNYSSPNNSCYRNETFDHNTTKSDSQKMESKSTISFEREVNRGIQKRSSDEVSIRNTRENSPKKLRTIVRHTQNIDKVIEKTIQKEDEMDPEMKEYRKKMEEQKRLREKILREKENRRKLAAMEKQNIQSPFELNNTENTKLDTIVAVAKENTKGKINFAVGKGRGRLISMQSTEVKTSGERVIRGIQFKQPKETNDNVNDDNQNNDDDNGNSSKDKLLKRIVINKTRNAQKSQKTTTNAIVNTNRQLGQIRQLLTNSQRIIVQSVANVQQKQQQITVKDKQQRQRIVVNKQPISETKKIKSNVIKVDNLAASTTEAQIRRMCQGIGSIESIQMGEGNAMIIFKTQSAAMVFHKKYQRKMLDLSLIKVQLVPQTSTINLSAALLKNTSKELIKPKLESDKNINYGCVNE